MTAFPDNKGEGRVQTLSGNTDVGAPLEARITPPWLFAPQAALPK